MSQPTQPTATPLVELIFDRLATDDVPADTAELVLAALTGEDDLAAALTGTPTRLDPHTPTGTDGPAGKIWLSSVTVAGFRGVGEERTVEIGPGLGITLVVGRNGSGKSSFAEAVELALTGDSARWADKTGVWRTRLAQPAPLEGRAGGIGYVASDGRDGLRSRRPGRHDPTGCSRVLVSELRAVEFLFTAYDTPPVGLTVLVDSRPALNYLHRWQAARPGRCPPATTCVPGTPA